MPATAISYPSRALSSDDSCRVAADRWDDRRGGRTSRRRSTVFCPLPPSTNVGGTGETTWKASDRFDLVPLTVPQFRILSRIVIADDPATVTSTVVETVRAPHHRRPYGNTGETMGASADLSSIPTVREPVGGSSCVRSSHRNPNRPAPVRRQLRGNPLVGQCNERPANRIVGRLGILTLPTSRHHQARSL
jgi:hypothetical protein